MRSRIVTFLSAMFICTAIGALVATSHIRSTTTKLNRLILLHQVEDMRKSLLLTNQTIQSNLFTYNTNLAEKHDVVGQNISSLELTSQKCLSCHYSPEVHQRLVRAHSLIEDYE